MIIQYEFRELSKITGPYSCFIWYILIIASYSNDSLLHLKLLKVKNSVLKSKLIKQVNKNSE